MYEVFKIELYKISKMDTWKYIIVICLIPILWAVYLYNGKAIFPESQYNMIQWVTVQMFALNEQFLMPVIFALITSQLFIKEIDEKYINLIGVRSHSFHKLYIGKLVSIIFYLVIMYIIISLLIGLSYQIVTIKSKLILSGDLFGVWKENFKAFYYWFLNLLFNCLLIPSLVFALGSKGNSYKALGVTCIYLFADHIFSSLSGVGNLFIWKYLKGAKYIIATTSTEIVMIRSIILVLLYSFMITIIGIRKFTSHYQRKS